MKNKHIFSCPIGEAISVFAGRWKPEILWHLKKAPLRFNQLQRAIGTVSQKMLTQQLRELERDGLVTRTQYREIPPRVEYECTALAHSLEIIFESLEKWHKDHGQTINRAQQAYDKRLNAS